MALCSYQHFKFFTILFSDFRSKDGVYTIKFLHCSIMGGPSVIVKFDGFKTEVKLSPMYRSKTCGLCGDLSGLKLRGLVGPRRCAYSAPELLVASYRTPSVKSCPALEPRIKSRLQQEQQECYKVEKDEQAQMTSTKVVKPFEAQVSKLVKKRAPFKYL